jgi:hypothetical protein
MKETYDNEKIEKKHPYLISVEGWYCATPTIPPLFRDVMNLYKESKSPMKATRWLLKNKLINEREAVFLGEFLKLGITFKLSCRHNDLVRCRKSPHYNSCLRIDGRHSRQVAINVQDKDLAVLFVPDKAGHMQYRALVRLVSTGKGFGLFVYHGYGNSDRNAIINALQVLNVKIIDGEETNAFDRRNTKMYRSVSRYRLTQDWSDHTIRYKNAHLLIEGSK